MTGKENIVNQVNLESTNNMFMNTAAIDKAIVKPKSKYAGRYCKCGRIASFNYENEPPEYCKEHSKDGMFDVRHKRCEHPGCKLRAHHNYPGNKSGIYCYEHRLEGMVNVIKYKTCKTPLCGTKIQSSSRNKYRGYCLRCFMHTFPNESVARNYKTKEKAVADKITEKFSNMTWTLDKTVEGGCSRRRPDLLCDMGPYILIVEIDEDKHVNYSCENKRMMELFQDVGNRPIIFIRFNPDSYKNKEGKRVTSCWRANKQGIMTVVKSKQKEWENRLKDLFEKIEYWSKNKPSKTITVEQLFYDELDDE